MVIFGPSNYYFKQPSHSIYSTPVCLQCKAKNYGLSTLILSCLSFYFLVQYTFKLHMHLATLEQT